MKEDNDKLWILQSVTLIATIVQNSRPLRCLEDRKENKHFESSKLLICSQETVWSSTVSAAKPRLQQQKHFQFMLILTAQAQAAQALTSVNGLRGFDHRGYSTGHWNGSIKEA